MYKFIEVPASKNSIAQRKLVYGIGINDADYSIENTNLIPRSRCPFYVKWHDMMKRCYSEKHHIENKTYINCTVTKEWLVFSKFKSWMIKQNWKGMALDKDILTYNNKIYSPDHCVFVTLELNNLLCNHFNKRGKYPIGVYYHKQNKNFIAQCTVNTKKEFLGSYNTQEEATKVYNKFISNLIEIEANKQSDIRIKEGLLVYADKYANGLIK